MADPLKARTERLLTDYLGYCAREPGAPEPQPSSPEAAVLRSTAAQLQRLHQPFFARCRGYPGNRVELLARMADAMLSDSQALSWGRVVALVTFAGTLLERGPPQTGARDTWGVQPRPKDEKGAAARDCQRLAALLCARLAGRHRAWLQDQGGWDGFCLFFRTSSPLISWRRLLIQAFLSCLLATALIYSWTRLL